MKKRVGMLLSVAALAGAPAAPASEASVEPVRVEASDGVELGGWLIRPGDAGDRKLPTVLISTPYIGQCIGAGVGGPCWPAPETPEDWAEHPEPVELLVRKGYAVAWFSVRGTGVSGGCWDDLGPREQRDQGELVEWVARQPWSNRRVGTMGISYMSQTALAAAAERPKALKTTVVSGINVDLYRFFHSPQGLAYNYTIAGGDLLYGADVSFSPPGTFRPIPGLVAARLAHHHERVCAEVVRAMAEITGGAVTGVRDARFWRERSLLTRLRKSRASVLVAHGLQDLWQSGHAQQEDGIWSLIKGEKAMYIGQWAHTYPWMTGHHDDGDDPRPDLEAEWHATLISWLDHYLKGGPRPDIVGRVRYEDDSRRWHASKAWPPRESRPESLYLRPDGSLGATPPAAESGLAFRSTPQAERATKQEAFMCPAKLDPVLGRQGLVFMTAPVKTRTVIAGNPTAHLDLTSDQPGGGFQIMLYDVAPGFGCATPEANDLARPLTIGGADLRFHHGGFDARPFASGRVRVDLANLAAVLEPGHRLAASVTYGDAMEHVEVGHLPQITVRSGPRAGSSQLVIPVLEGGFGGR